MKRGAVLVLAAALSGCAAHDRALDLAARSVSRYCEAAAAPGADELRASWRAELRKRTGADVSIRCPER